MADAKKSSLPLEDAHVQGNKRKEATSECSAEPSTAEPAEQPKKQQKSAQQRGQKQQNRLTLEEKERRRRIAEKHHKHWEGWTWEKHWGFCTQSCPCCRSQVGDDHGYCEMCSSEV